MPIPKIYAKQGTDAIASYNYVDISEGTGVTKFYGFDAASSGTTGGSTTSYSLTTDTIYSNYVEYSGAPIALRFDLTPFNKPQIIRGTALIRFSAGTDTGTGKTLWFLLNLLKVDENGVETTLGETSTAEIISAAGRVFMNLTSKMKINEVKIKRGEKLRLLLTPYGQPLPTSCFVSHDPANRDGIYITPASTYPTKLEVYVPFKIDI